MKNGMFCFGKSSLVSQIFKFLFKNLWWCNIVHMRVINSIIIPLLRHFTIFGQENVQNMRRHYTVEQSKYGRNWSFRWTKLFSTRYSLTQSSEPRWGSIRHRQTSSIQTGPGPATAARSTSFQLFSSRPWWSSAKCRVVYPGASSQGAPKTAPRVGAGLSSCEGHGQATSTVFFSPPERCYSPLCASISPHCTPFLATWLSIFSVSISLRSPEVCSPTSCWFSTSLRRREELNIRWTGRFWA